jgi:hypothetical protein
MKLRFQIPLIVVCATLLPTHPALAQFSQQGPKLVGISGVGTVFQGASVSLAADGNTAIIGDRSGNSGGNHAAWIWTRNGDIWTQQGPNLLGSDAVGNQSFGYAVSISADGNTAIVGGPSDGSCCYRGAAWIWTRSGGVWTQQGPKLVGSGAVTAAQQGTSVSISADGNTAIVGGPSDNYNGVGATGAAWVWTRSGELWTQQGPKLVASGNWPNAGQGRSVSLSADGNTAIVNGAWVWTRSAGVWTQQGNMLSGGSSSSLSADGNTAIVGNYGDSNFAGAAWVWTRSGEIWTQQGPKLVGSGAVGAAQQGCSVSLSADGNTAFIGGPADNSSAGATWTWTRSGEVWTQQGNKLVGSGAVGNAQQGTALSLAGDGRTAIVGGHFDNSGAGAAWVFAAAPLFLAPVPSLPAGSGLSTSPTFSWSAVGGATSYRLMVATSAGVLPTDPAASTCGGCAINTTTPTNYYIPSSSLSATTTYFWQVTGRSATQNGTWSTRPSFTTAAVGGLTITGVSPSPLVGSGSSQTLRIFGSAFQPGMTATLVNTTTGGAPSVKATSSLTSTQASISATFPAVAANWTVMVTNPGGSTSGVYSFRVISPAAIGSDLQVSGLTIDPIAPLQTAGSAFAVTVKAVDAHSVVLPIDADIQLQTRAGAVNPSRLRLIGGVGSAQVKIDSPGCGVELAAAGAGATGTSNPFSVQGAGQGSLAGNVVNENGQPLSGVVTLTGCGGSINVTAGPSGKYISPQIAAGTYKAYATFNSVTSGIVTVTVMANSCIRLNDLVISTCNPNGQTPILFLPGIMGSTTDKGSFSVPSLPAYSPSQELAPPYTPSDDWAAGPTLNLNGLYISTLTNATRWDHLVTAIGIRNGAYVSFIPQLGYVPRPCMIIPVPYDWRMRPDDAARKYLVPRIKAAKAQAGVSKVHIVAHSMGGLVARSYIQSAEYAFDVDRLAMVGTPNAGAEIAYLMAEGGNPRRADIVAITNESPFIAVNLYTRVAEGMYTKTGRDLGSIKPPSCRSSSPISGSCAAIEQMPEHWEWDPYRKEMKRFFANRVPSMQALLPDNRNFLREAGAPDRTIGCAGFQNQFLKDLNAPAPGSHIDRIGGASATGNVVKTKIFAGIQKNTVGTFTVKSRPSNCLAETLSPDGEYLGFTPTSDGDGTVRRESVLAAFTDLAAPHAEGKHSDLLTVYRSGIADFLFGISSSSRTANEPEEATAERIGATASVAAPNVELRVSGRARPYLFNGSGEGCGLNPGTSEFIQTLPGCSSIDARPQESLLGLTGISNGVYTLAVTSAWPEESVLSSTLDDGSDLSEASATFFFKPETRSLTLTIAAGTTAPIRIDGPVGPPMSLHADATEAPRAASLNWTASGDPNVIGYDVYSKRDDEPKLALLAQMAGTTYETSDAWADAAGIPIRHYAVAARVASGQTSVLTEFAANDDRDHDGLTDVDESRYQTDPGNPDTDGDALKDGDEIAIGSDPRNPDSDGDGYPDGLESARGSDPLEPGSTPVALQVPPNVVATATSTSQVQVSWGAVAGATSYQVFRSFNNGAYVLVATPAVNTFADSTVTAGTTYLYAVKAVDSAATASVASSADLATTIMFTDDPLVGSFTPIKAVHLTQLRSAINAVRAAAGLPAMVFSSSMAIGLPIRAAHVSELRSSLDAARTALGLSVPAYPDTVLGVGTARVRGVHISSLRDGVR